MTVKKHILFHLRLLVCGNETFTTHLRMIDMFTSESTLARYIRGGKVVEFVYEVSLNDATVESIASIR